MPNVKAKRRTRKPDSDAVLEAANGYIVRHYPFGCLGNHPQKLAGKMNLWIVQVYLTSPGYGAVGEVGLVAVDASAGIVVAATQRPQVVQAIKLLKEAKHDELAAAFHQARTV